MSEAPNNDRQLLEALIFDSDLERLETLLAEFNIFEAIGAVRQELRHSDFLAFLLNPNQNHGLGDVFLKHLLRHLLIELPEPPLNAIELDLIDMDQAIVLREWQNIDILIDDAEQNSLICLIENKIGTTEHSGQLRRYLKTVRQKYPEATIIPVYLTPEGDEASEEGYLNLSYTRWQKFWRLCWRLSPQRWAPMCVPW
jgi:hypothetical protein